MLSGQVNALIIIRAEMANIVGTAIAAYSGGRAGESHGKMYTFTHV